MKIKVKFECKRDEADNALRTYLQDFYPKVKDNAESISLKIDFTDEKVKGENSTEASMQKVEVDVPTEANVQNVEANELVETDVQEEEADEPAEANVQEVEAYELAETNVQEDKANESGESDESKVTSKITGQRLLDELAKKSNSFEDFANGIIDLLKIAKHVEVFKELVFASTKFENFDWKTLKQELLNNGMDCSDYDRWYCNSKISKSKLNMTFLKFMKLMPTYKAYFDSREGADEPVENNVQEDKANESVESDESKVTSKITGQKILDELAEKSNSFENFVNALIDLLKIAKHVEVFKELLFVATKFENCAWTTLVQELANNGRSCTDNERWYFFSKISKSELNITLLPFLNFMPVYKLYFDSKGENASEVDKDEREISQESNNDEQSTEKPAVCNERFKPLRCLRGIPEMETTFSYLDMTQPIEGRVQFVLYKMGLQKKTVLERNRILEIANTAMKGKYDDLDSIMKDTRIDEEDWSIAYMTFSEMVNTYLEKYHTGRMVKIFDFLQELKSAIVLESELEDESN